MSDQTRIVLAVLVIAWTIVVGMLAAVLLRVDIVDQAWAVLGGIALAGVSGALGWVTRGLATPTPQLPSPAPAAGQAETVTLLPAATANPPAGIPPAAAAAQPAAAATDTEIAARSKVTP